MRLLIDNGFAKEKEDNADKECGCDCACCQVRNSQYWIDKKGAATTAREYIAANLKKSGKDLEEMMEINFEETWDNFDVLKIGRIEVEQMSPLLKRILGDVTIPIQ